MILHRILELASTFFEKQVIPAKLHIFIFCCVVKYRLKPALISL